MFALFSSSSVTTPHHALRTSTRRSAFHKAPTRSQTTSHFRASARLSPLVFGLFYIPSPRTYVFRRCLCRCMAWSSSRLGAYRSSCSAWLRLLWPWRRLRFQNGGELNCFCSVYRSTLGVNHELRTSSHRLTSSDTTSTIQSSNPEAGVILSINRVRLEFIRWRSYGLLAVPLHSSRLFSFPHSGRTHFLRRRRRLELGVPRHRMFATDQGIFHVQKSLTFYRSHYEPRTSPRRPAFNWPLVESCKQIEKPQVHGQTKGASHFLGSVSCGTSPSDLGFRWTSARLAL